MVPHAADATTAAVPCPKIFQLSPLPGNIYEMDRFYYDPAATLDSGAIGALLAFAMLTVTHSWFTIVTIYKNFTRPTPLRLSAPLLRSPQRLWLRVSPSSLQRQLARLHALGLIQD